MGRQRALFRGLASLPVLPSCLNTGLLQVVQLDDVADTVLFFLLPAATHPALMRSTLQGLRQLPLPKWFASTAAGSVGVKTADYLPPGLGRRCPLPSRLTSRDALGWRPPLRSTAQSRSRPGGGRRSTRVVASNQASPPQSLSAALAREPASVQERWFAALYLLKPVLFSVLFRILDSQRAAFDRTGLSDWRRARMSEGAAGDP